MDARARTRCRLWRCFKKLQENKLNEEVTLPAMGRRLAVAGFVIEGGELKLIKDDTTVLVVPKSKRRAAFDEAHQ